MAVPQVRQEASSKTSLLQLQPHVVRALQIAWTNKKLMKRPLTLAPLDGRMDRSLRRRSVLGFVGRVAGLKDATHAAQVLLKGPSLQAVVTAPCDSFPVPSVNHSVVPTCWRETPTKAGAGPSGRWELPLQPERERPPKASFMDA